MAGLYAANLSEMRGKVRDWADTAVITDGVIDDFINIAVGRLADLTRVRQMETKVVLPITDYGIDLPDDYLETKSLKVTYGSRDVYLETKSLDFVEEYRGVASGEAMYFGRKEDRLVMAPDPSGVTEAELIYWKEPPTLVDDTDTDWFITKNTAAVLYGALVELGVYVTDDEFAAGYESKFMQAMTEIQAIEDKANWSGDTLSVST